MGSHTPCRKPTYSKVFSTISYSLLETYCDLLLLNDEETTGAFLSS